MPRGSKEKYTDTQKRQVEHIEEGYRAAASEVSDDNDASAAGGAAQHQGGGGSRETETNHRAPAQADANGARQAGRESRTAAAARRLTPELQEVGARPRLRFTTCVTAGGSAPREPPCRAHGRPSR